MADVLQMPDGPSARVDLPAEKFPVTFEAFHPETRVVVWRATVRKPKHLVALYIPPLKNQLGHPVGIRCTFADGTVQESGPKEDDDAVHDGR